MKRLRIISLILTIFFVTGCEVNYELNFVDDTLDEKISVVLSEDENTSENLESMDYMAANEAFAISKRLDQRLYNYTRKKNTGIFDYSYSVDNFNDNHMIDQCYDSFNFVQTEKGYSLTTSDTFRCGAFNYMPVDKYNIVITTNKEVLTNNADRVEGNKYIWEIDTRGNVNIKKPTRIMFSFKTQQDILRDKLKDNSDYVLVGILSVLFIGIVGLLITFTIKSRRNQD